MKLDKITKMLVVDKTNRRKAAQEKAQESETHSFAH